MTQPLEDWQSQEGLVKGEYTSDVIFLGWLPGHTRRAVAIDLGEGQGIRNDRGQQTLAGCKSSSALRDRSSYKPYWGLTTPQ